MMPDLNRIEDEGRAAMIAVAEELVQQTIGSGGKIDIERLRKLGPDVREEYDRILGERAAPISKVKPSTPGASDAPGKKASIAPPKGALPPRIKTGWPELRRWRFRFTTEALSLGIFVGLASGILVSIVLRYRNL